MNQTDFAQAVAPIVDAVVTLEKRVSEIELIPGPQGPAGESAIAPTAEEVASVLVARYAEELKGDPGRDGADVHINIDDVTTALKSSPEFLALARGESGEQGPQGEPGLTGKDGADGLGIDSPYWTPGIYREGARVQHYVGQHFKALRDTASEPGREGDWVRVGTGGFHFCGTKSAQVDYQDGDLYIDDGTTFLWQGGKSHMVARRGKDGKPGTDGRPGAPGQDAPRIVDLVVDAKGFALALSDGSMVESGGGELAEWIKSAVLDALDGAVLRQKLREGEPEGATPVRRFRGEFSAASGYEAGDLVTLSGALYSARRDILPGDFSQDGFTRLTSGPQVGRPPQATNAPAVVVMTPKDQAAIAFSASWRHQIDIRGHAVIGAGPGNRLACRGLSGFDWASVAGGIVTAKTWKGGYINAMADECLTESHAALIPEGVTLAGNSYALVRINIQVYTDQTSIVWEISGYDLEGSPVNVSGVAVWGRNVLADIGGIRLFGLQDQSPVTCYLQAGGY